MYWRIHWRTHWRMYCRSPSFSFFVVGHGGAKHLACTEDLDLHLRERTPHEISDLVVGKTVIEPEKEHRASLLRETLQRRFDDPERFTSEKLGLRRSGRRDVMLGILGSDPTLRTGARL